MVLIYQLHQVSKMNRTIKILLAFPLFLFVIYNSSCDYVEDPIAPVYGDLDTSLYPGPGFYVIPEFDETFPSTVKNILLEDYTGHTCGNCPSAAEIAHELKATYPERVFVASVHASPNSTFQDVYEPGDPYYPEYSHDFRTPEGNEYVVDIVGFPGNPVGMINRMEDNSGSNWIFHPFWGEAIDEIIAENPALDMNLQVKTNYYTETRGLFVHVQSKTLESLEGSYSMVVFLIQDDFVAWQKDYRLPTSQQNIEDYHHHDVFLGTINGAYGTLLFDGVSNPDESFQNDYSYQIPDDIDILGTSPGDPTGLSIIAFLMNTESFEIIQVTEVGVPVTN
jgi:hypothetical protein